MIGVFTSATGGEDEVTYDVGSKGAVSFTLPAPLPTLHDLEHGVGWFALVSLHAVPPRIITSGALGFVPDRARAPGVRTSGEITVWSIGRLPVASAQSR